MKSAMPSAANSGESPKDAKRLSGTVLLPTGNPAAGAHVVVMGELRQGHRTIDSDTDQSVILAHTMCDRTGKFELKAAGLSSQRYLRVHLLVRTAGTGLAWRGLNPDDPDASFSIKLPEEAHARGRLVTLEGQPAGGVRVTVLGVTRSGTRGSGLDDGVYVSDVAPAEVWPTGVVSDADGWFTVPGIAADVDLGLYIHQEPYAPERLSFERMATDTSKHVFAMSPAQIIKGVVVAVDTGKPLANAPIQANQNWEGDFNRGMFAIEGKTDAEGRFRVNPYAAKAYTVTAVGAKGMPYLAKQIEIKWSETEREHEMRIELPRGVLVRGTVVEEPSGQPVAKATVRYTASSRNVGARGIPLYGLFQPTELSDELGHFTIAVPAGPGHLTVKSATGEYVLKELDARQIAEGRPGWRRLYVNADAAIEPADDAREQPIQFKIHRGASVAGELVRSDGRPPQRTIMLHRGLMLPYSDEFWMANPAMFAGNRFEIRGVPPDDDLPVFLLDPDARQGKRLAVRASDSGQPLRVKLDPCGSLTMRFVDLEGKPIAGHSPSLMMVFTPGKSLYDFGNNADGPRADETFIQNFDRVNNGDPTSDETGRVIFPALIPGVAYRLMEIAEKDQEQKPPKYREITVKPGERLELPDIVIRNPDVLRYAEDERMKKQKEQAMKAATPSAANSGESPKQMPTGTTSAVQAPTVERAMSNAAAQMPRSATAPATDQKPFAAISDDAPLLIRGQVVGPDGKAVAGAKLFLLYWNSGKMPERGVKPSAETNAEGRFDFSVKKSDFDPAAGDDWIYSRLVATADGFGFAVGLMADFDASGNIRRVAPPRVIGYLAKLLAGKQPALRLAPDDAPLTGHIVSLEGKPIAGARVALKELWTNEQGSLDAWEKAAKEPKADFYSIRMKAGLEENAPQLPLIVPAVTTDRDGRFTMRGIGRERIVRLMISGAGIETKLIRARTRSGEKVVVPNEWRERADIPRDEFYANNFTHVAAPSNAVVGRVTDRVTGKPLAGATVMSQKLHGNPIHGWGQDYIRATTDADGRYRLEGMPLGEDNEIGAFTMDDPYLPINRRVHIDLGNEPVKLDFQLPRGIWIEGRVTDKTTGKPISGHVEYFVFWSNPSYKQLDRPERITVDLRDHHHADANGRFRIAALPGPGIIGVLADDASTYASRGAGGEKIAEGNTKMGALTFPTSPYVCTAVNFNVLTEVNPRENADAVKLDLKLTSGATVTGKLIDADGKPVVGALYCGDSPEYEIWASTNADSFQVFSYEPNQSRRLIFYEAKRNLAGMLMLSGDPPKPLVVRLDAAGSVRGRLVDEHGSPLAGMMLLSGLRPARQTMALPASALPLPLPPPDSKRSNLDPTTDEQGRFEIHGLIPGKDYLVRARGNDDRGFDGQLADSITVHAGETKDLGDVSPKPVDSADDVAAMNAEAAAKSRPAEANSIPRNSAKSNADRTAKPPTDSRNDSTQSDRKADDDLLSVRGRVLDPQGNPVAGADVAAVEPLWKVKHDSLLVAAAKSDEAGRFNLEFHKSQFAAGQGEAWQSAIIVASMPAAQYGMTWRYFDSIKPSQETILQLAPDEPIEGRIVDLEGRPIAEVEARIGDINTNAKGDLTTWLGALHGGIPFFGSESYDWPDRFLYTEFVGRWATKTDADGRFRLSGVGHDRVATIYISGGGVAAADLKVVTRPMEPFKVDMSSMADSPDSTTYYGSHFQYAAEPAQPIEGIVRDAKTRQPLAGVRVVSYKFAGRELSGLNWIDTVSDDRGRFRLKGMPKGEGNKILAIPADNQPYFQQEFDVPTAAGLEPVKFDLELHRGVPIRGRVTDKSSGAPVEGARMFFIPWPDNPNIAGMAEYGHGWVHGSQMRYLTDHDGRYALVGLPGRGLIEVDCPTQPFPPGQGLRDITDLPTPQQFLKVAGALMPSANYTTAVKETHIGEKDADALANIELDPGKRLTLNIVDPNGKPLTGVEVKGLFPPRHSRTQYDAGPTAEVIALSPDENRIIRLYRKEHNLGQVRSVCWKDDGAGPVTVKLELCATLKARLMDKNGDPIRGGRVGIQAQIGDSGTMSDMASTDRDGRLNYTRLLPRGKYNVTCACAQVGLQLLVKDLSVSPGEIIDLGEFDVTSKDRPKPKRTNAISSEIEPKTPGPADGKGEMKSPAAAGRNDSTQSDRKADDDLFSVNGRVLDPQGKPAAGAKVAAVQDYFTTWSHTSAAMVTTESDNAGRFHLEFRKSDIVQSDQLLQRVSIIAKPLDSKLGIAWIRCDAIKPGEETILQLVADVPVEGRIVDLEGRPIAGVEVRVNELSANAKGDLTAWLSAQKSGVTSVNDQDLDIPDRNLATEFANEWKTKTDADGHFRLTGLGRDRVVDILVSGHGTAAALRVVTRPMEPVSVDAAHRSVVPILNVYYGSHFQYAVEPSQPIVGVVRDAKTGRPLAGVQVVSDRLAGRFSGILSWTTRDTVSDAKGNYRLDGLPKGEGNQIVAIPADGEPYFMRSFDVPTALGFEPVKLDLEMHRGVLIHGRVSDNATGAPVAGARMFFVPWPDNPNVNNVADLTRGQRGDEMVRRYQTDRDGRYTLVGVPGRGLVEVASVRLPRVYPPGQGLREIADLPSPREFFRVAGSQDPPDPKRTVAAKEIHIGRQDVQVRVDIELESGKQLSLSVVDPEGKRLADVKVNGDLPREYAWRQITAGPRIDVMALWPEEERRIVLYQKERNLGKVIRVCWNNDRPGPVTVKLEPCATLKGRLLDKDGDPVQGVSLHFIEADRMDSTLPLPRGATDRDGRLNYTALVPGARYMVYCDAGPGSIQSIATDLSVSPGEIIDLGEFDVTSKDRPKPKRTNGAILRPQTNTTSPADSKAEMKSPAAAGEMRKQP
jgi:protocatechuate 3,4-dioxygenase beta subunit